jgi:hypothetical protein
VVQPVELVVRVEVVAEPPLALAVQEHRDKGTQAAAQLVAGALVAVALVL